MVGRIRITEPLAPLNAKIACSRCGEGRGVAWAIPVDFYEQQDWAGHRFVCRRCADELTAGQDWDARRAPRRQRSHEEVGNENRRLEHAAIDLFIPLYNDETGRVFRLLRMHEEPDDRPDAVLEAADGGQLGVEIAHLGYAYAQGEHSSGARNEMAFLLDRVRASMSETQKGDRLIDELNRIMADKAERYASVVRHYPITLLVRVANPIFTLTSFELYRHDVVTPARSPFKETWLLPRDDDGSGWAHLVRLA